MKPRTLAAAFGLWLCLGTAAPAATLYECVMQPSRANAWISDFIFIGHDAEAGRVVVSDPNTLVYNDRRPATGRVVADNPRRITFAWPLTVRYLSGERVRLRYRLTYLRDSGTAMAIARAPGRDELYQAAGRCLVKTPPAGR